MAATPRLVTLALLAVIAAAAILYFRHRSPAPATAIATATVTRGDVAELVEATGTVQAVTTVQVGTQVSGTITALPADFNAQVRRG